nr:hypothetical protein [Tanacetum cinerariifolium]
MSKLMYTRVTKLIIDHILSCNKSIPCRSDSDIHSEGQDLPLSNLTNTIKGTYKFEMEILDTMINDVFKKSVGYKYYKTKKGETEKAKADEVPEEQHVYPVKVKEEKVICVQAKQAVRVEGSSAAHNKYYEFENISATDSDATQDSLRLDTDEARDDETDDSDDSNMDLSEDETKGDDDAA